MESQLRKAIIRLAYQKPELRPVLLPLVKKQAVLMPPLGRLPLISKQTRRFVEMLADAAANLARRNAPPDADLDDILDIAEEDVDTFFQAMCRGGWRDYM